MDNISIEEIVREVSYRCHDGKPNWKNKTHISILSEVLSEYGLGSVKHDLIRNLVEGDNDGDKARSSAEVAKDNETASKYYHKGNGIYVKMADKDKEIEKVGNKFTKDDNGNFKPISDAEIKRIMDKNGEAGGSKNNPYAKPKGGEKPADVDNLEDEEMQKNIEKTFSDPDYQKHIKDYEDAVSNASSDGKTNLKKEKEILSKLDKDQKSARKHILKSLNIDQIKSNNPNITEDDINYLTYARDLFDEFLNNDTPDDKKQELAQTLKDTFKLSTNRPTTNEDGDPQPVKLYIKQNHNGGKVPRSIEKALTTKSGGSGTPQTQLVNELNKYLADNPIKQNTIGGDDERRVAITFETAAKPTFTDSNGKSAARTSVRKNPKANTRRKDKNNPGYDMDGNPLTVTDPLVSSIFKKGTALGDLRESMHSIDGPSDDQGNLIPCDNPDGIKVHLNFMANNNESFNRVQSEAHKIINNPDVNEHDKIKFRKLVGAIDDYKKAFNGMISMGNIPSGNARKKMEKLNAKFMDDLFNSNPDIAGGMAKQFAETVLVSEELMGGDEVYMPTSGVFPGGDKIHVSRNGSQIVGVTGMSIKFGRGSKETQIYGFPGESQSMANFAEPDKNENESEESFEQRKQEMRTRNGRYVGQNGNLMGVRDDIVDDMDKQQQIISAAGFDEVISNKDEFYKINTLLKKSIIDFKESMRNQTPPPDEKFININIQKHLKTFIKENNIQEKLENVIDRTKLVKILTGTDDGMYETQNGDKKRHSNTVLAQKSDPIELLNIMTFVSSMKEGKGMPSLAWNHQSYEDGEYHSETIDPNETDMTNPANWGFMSRMYVTTGRQGGGILTTGTGEFELKNKPLKNV